MKTIYNLFLILVLILLVKFTLSVFPAKDELVPVPPTLKPTITKAPEVKKQVIYTTKAPAQIDCTGPDGVVFRTSEIECREFNEAWGNVQKPQQVVQEKVIYVQGSKDERIEADYEWKREQWLKCLDSSVFTYNQAVEGCKGIWETSDEIYACEMRALERKIENDKFCEKWKN